MRLRNIIIVAALLVVAVPLIAAGFFVLAFNPNAYAPQVEAAVAAATGRTLTLQSPIRVAFTPSPVIEADNVTLANPPGFPDASFLTLQELKAKIRLLPLLSHRIDIFDLVLESPSVTLESNAAGQSDWDFSATSPPSPTTPSTPAPASGFCDEGCGSNGQVCCTSGPACAAPLSCGGGGQAGVCGCTPSCGADADGGVACGASAGCGGICQGASNTCPEGQRCVNGGICICDPTSCPQGCCAGSKCVVNGGDPQCGTGGAACVDCDGGGCNVTCQGSPCGGADQDCCAGSGCIEPLTCNAGKCTCTPSCAGKACGEGDDCGGTCLADGDASICPMGQTCSKTLGTCTCDPTSCPTGCCVSGVCIDGNQSNLALCGTGGTACIACSAGQICTGGACVSPDDGGS